MSRKRISIILVLFIITLCISVIHCSTEPKRPIDYIDPFICTLGDHGQLFPGAVVPFGMVKLSPDTYPSSLIGDGDWAHSGYNYADNKIRGFSHIRIGSSGGTSIFDRGWHISMLPIVGKSEEFIQQKYIHSICQAQWKIIQQTVDFPSRHRQRRKALL